MWKTNTRVITVKFEDLRVTFRVTLTVTYHTISAKSRMTWTEAEITAKSRKRNLKSTPPTTLYIMET